MTTQQKTYIGIAVVVLAIIIFWKPISNLWKGDMASNTPVDGTGCTTEDGKTGIYSGGVCTATGGPRPTGPNGGGIGVGETGRTGVSKTHCIPKQMGATCQPRIYVNGHWFAIDQKNTTATTCCYTMIN